MSMRRLPLLLLAVLATAMSIAVLPAGAGAARPKAAKPTITRVTPMRVDVGETLVIRGTHFKARPRANTVVFTAGNGKTAFAKPRSATTRKLVVKVPASVMRLLNTRDGSLRPTRIRLRVLAGRFSAFTPRRLSPVITGGGSGVGGGEPLVGCKDDSDHDNDLLSNATELALGTNPCVRDSDGDAVEDGYEVQAAIDLNHYPSTTPLPYPGKRPYPNALDPSDAQTDYDGDGLRLREEFLLWLGYSADGAPRPGRPASLFPLVYSDGLQKSVSPPPAAPGDALYNWVLDQDEDGTLSDGERDADADGLGNWDEVRGRFTEKWWPAIQNGDIAPRESDYPDEFGNFLDNEDLPNEDAHANPDIDGDGIVDGLDDQDHDGLFNQFEIRRPDDWIADAITGFPTASNPWAYVNPFNPCKPFDSERCHEHPPLGYYDNDDVPPIGPQPPAGYPGSHPATPDGP
jgi:hypothetical protein